MATHYIQKYDSAAQFAALSPDTPQAGPVGIINGAFTLGDITNTSATPGTIDGFSVAKSTAVSLTSGTVDSIRGATTVPTGTTLSTGVFVYGVTGRTIVNGTVDIGSGSLAAGYFKSDYNGATLTSGHIAPLQANIVNPPAGTSAKLDLVYVESAAGGIINSYFKAFGKSTYVFDFESNVHNQMSTTGTCTPSADGWLKVLVDGAVRYIPLADSVS